MIETIITEEGFRTFMFRGFYKHNGKRVPRSYIEERRKNLYARYERENPKYAEFLIPSTAPKWIHKDIIPQPINTTFQDDVDHEQ